jgi:hypothetical protein
MNYPTIDQFAEALQQPAVFSDPVLRAGKLATNSLGLPAVLGGGFALTFTVVSGSKKFAVRCFHKHAPDIEKRYRSISGEIAGKPDAYFVEFDFQPKGVRVNGVELPIVKMAWAEGTTLGQYVEDNFNKRGVMEALLKNFRDLESHLRGRSIAHGDLQNGNVLVKSGIKLIDYDGVFVPKMEVGKGSEIGHRHFQHPLRGPEHFGPQMDRFSFIVIDVSLRALIERPDLFQAHSNGENLVFSASDLLDPSNSKAFRDTRSISLLTKDVENFARLCTSKVEDIPPLDDFLNGRGIPAKSIIFTPAAKAKAGTSAPTEAAYIGAFPVVNAAAFDDVMSMLGDKIELVGCIVQVQSANTRYGRPYAFIMFGRKDDNIARVTIWSEGLEKLSASSVVPDKKSWTGRWVSITGLVEKPYRYAKKGNLHVGITISETSQIRFITTDEAKRRLKTAGIANSKIGSLRASTSGGPTKNADILRGLGISKPGGTSGTASGASISKNAALLKGLQSGASSRSPSSPHSQSSGTSGAPYSAPPTSSGGGAKWIWWVLGALALWFMLGRH